MIESKIVSTTVLCRAVLRAQQGSVRRRRLVATFYEALAGITRLPRLEQR